MKRVHLLLPALVLAAALALTACGSTADTAAPADGADAAPAADAAADNGDTGEAAPAEDGEVAPAEDAAPAVTAAENEVAYRGTVLKPGIDAEPVIEALGEPDDVSEDISCMVEGGMDQVYTYPDLTIYAYALSEEQSEILMIELTSDQVATARGVKLGDSLDSALLLYSDILQGDGSGTRYTAEIDGVELVLNAMDGKVSDISYDLPADQAPAA